MGAEAVVVATTSAPITGVNAWSGGSEELGDGIPDGVRDLDL